MRPKWDWLLFSLVIATGAISLLVIYSIDARLGLNQLIFWVFGLCLFYAVSQLDYKIWQNIAPRFYILVLASLALLLFIGEPVRGSIRWIDLGIFRFQPAELAKVAGIFLIADFYNRRSALNLRNVAIAFLLLLPAIVMVFVQPDIGNTLAFFAIWLVASFIAGFKLKNIAVLAVVLLSGVLIISQFLAPYQRQRLESFLNPQEDPLGTGYNIIQAKIAAGSGQIFGKGFGHGSQSQLNFLPEAESDFIFASIAEQLGLVGGALLLIIYGGIIAQIIKTAREKERFAQLTIAGVTAFFVLQFAVNVGMNMGLLPVTGITFPLVSYGGSSLITSLFMLGIVFSISRRSRQS